MPGSSHDVDPTFMDELPYGVRDAALDLIRFCSLRELLEMRNNGPTERLQKEFKLSPMQWNEVVNAVILTKISYFNITITFPNVYIDRLVEIAAAVYGLPGKGIADLYHVMHHDHPVFGDWLKNCVDIKQKKLKNAKKKQSA